jgi:uncharacterized protein (DUF1778 family)
MEEADRPAKPSGPRAERRDETIHIRASRQTKDLIESAASVEGKSLSDFVLDSARKQATDVLLDQRLFVLDAGQYDAFVHALDNPPPPGQRLKLLMKRQPRWQK